MDIADSASVVVGQEEEEEEVPREEAASMTCMADALDDVAVGWTSYYFYCCH